VNAFRQGTPNLVIDIDQDLRRRAGECGYRSMLVAIGAIEGLDAAPEVLHYEAPFGVGYLVAQLITSNHGRNARRETDVAGSGETHSDLSAHRELPALARRAVETFVNDRLIIDPPADSEILAQRAACFVSIKTRDGDLRGCIGTTEPTMNTLAEELIANAVSAATRDPRFPPIQKMELKNLKYSVDVLSEPEPAKMKDLDPRTYGVIVEGKESGRRGLLLPNLEGVDTAEKQVEIAARKAGIAPGAKLNLWRFRADRNREEL
jgi:AmmeMemoRadiSam system protein A